VRRTRPGADGSHRCTAKRRERGAQNRGRPLLRTEQAAHAAEVIVKITGPSAKIAAVMATMATAMATATAKPSMRGVS
jgi:hypothetical protein